MSAWLWRGLGCAVVLFAASACGGGKKKQTGDGGVSTGSGVDAGKKKAATDAGVAKKPVPKRDAGGMMDAGAVDAGTDAEMNPFAYDAAGDYHPIEAGAVGGPPDAWICPKALWNDGYCDCGCGVRDFDCKQSSCIDPGCVYSTCDACFTLSGSWKACEPDPDPKDWSCSTAQMADGLCDCGCGIPDPDCRGRGCSAPGCRTSACQVRHGCNADMTAAGDDCSSANPRPLTNGTWTCAWDHYGSGDGCDCGCGAADPDCGGTGCSAARCFTSTCTTCYAEQGRPYACDAAQAGWDEDIIGNAQTQEPSQCNATHFGTNDGCDCGCGGHDPDCGSAGCDSAGCSDAACKRCTDVGSLKPTGCAPADWSTNKCNPDNYGTGDGCDCGCGVPDPDCNGGGCTTAGCKDTTCDVCNDGAGYFVICPRWTCGDLQADTFKLAQCDCGCGVVDPYCRKNNWLSCTDPGCETSACDHCTDSGGVRTVCGGQWQSGNGGASTECSLKDYGVDGLCDCGCGVIDPDCKKDEGCTDKGCLAKGCEVCHDGLLLSVCEGWTCDWALYGSKGDCDCGCGGKDPDCGNGGCKEPGCKDAACKVCHDPYGRVLPCP